MPRHRPPGFRCCAVSGADRNPESGSDPALHIPQAGKAPGPCSPLPYRAPPAAARSPRLARARPPAAPPHARPGPAAAPPVLCYSRGRGRRGRSESKPGWNPEPLRDRPAPAGFRRRGLGLCPKCPAWVPRARPVLTARRALGPRQPAPGRPLADSAPPAPGSGLRRCAPSAPRPSGHSQALCGCGL